MTQQAKMHTPTQADLSELIEKLEKCEGPNLELESAIYLAVVAGDPEREFYERVKGECSATQALGRLGIKAPAYTCSFDAAFKLVPHGWFWQVGFTTSFRAWARVYEMHPDHTEEGKNEFSVCRRHDQTGTPILAICIASLKARTAK